MVPVLLLIDKPSGRPDTVYTTGSEPEMEATRKELSTPAVKVKDDDAYVSSDGACTTTTRGRLTEAEPAALVAVMV